MTRKKNKAIIIDLDGTLYNSSGRVHYVENHKRKYFDKFHKASSFDLPHQWCIDIINKFKSDHQIIYCSGRDNAHRQITEDWLEKYDLPRPPEALLLMREDKDYRKDDIVKKEIYELQIKDEYDIVFILDDRPSVCRMFRSLGLTVLQCQDKEF